MDVIIFGGQSNMQGQTEGLPTVNEPVKGALEYHIHGNELVALQHPVGEDFYPDVGVAQSSKGGGSLVPACCRAYVQATGREVVAIHAARGNTTIREWQKGTQRFENMSKKIRAGLEKVKELGEIGHIYYVWLQGESDAIVGTTTEAYVETLKKYKDTLKAEFGIEKFGIIKVGYFFCTSQWHQHIGTYESRKVFDEAIMQAQEQAVENDEDFVMLTRICTEMSMNKTYINPEASGHYNNAGMEIIGGEVGNALAKLS